MDVKTKKYLSLCWREGHIHLLSEPCRLPQCLREFTYAAVASSSNWPDHSIVSSPLVATTITCSDVDTQGPYPLSHLLRSQQPSSPIWVYTREVTGQRWTSANTTLLKVACKSQCPLLLTSTCLMVTCIGHVCQTYASNRCTGHMHQTYAFVCTFCVCKNVDHWKSCVYAKRNVQKTIVHACVLTAFICMRVPTRACVCVHACVLCVHVCVYICMFVCMHVHVCVCMHASESRSFQLFLCSFASLIYWSLVYRLHLNNTVVAIANFLLLVICQPFPRWRHRNYPKVTCCQNCRSYLVV